MHRQIMSAKYWPFRSVLNILRMLPKFYAKSQRKIKAYIDRRLNEQS